MDGFIKPRKRPKPPLLNDPKPAVGGLEKPSNIIQEKAQARAAMDINADLPSAVERPTKVETPPTSIIPEENKPAKDKKFKRLRGWIKQHRKLSVLIIVATLLALGAAGYFGLKMLYSDRLDSGDQNTTKKVEKKPEPITVASPLTGALVDPALANRSVTAFMIENSIDARPQSGLHQAGVIFEAIAEGGITRFVALYQEADTDYIGPVRSVRPYYVEWAAGFDAALAHVGGSVDGLEAVRSYGRDLDEFANGSYFTRITERYAPHNTYTSLSQMLKLQDKLGLSKSSFTPWARKKPAALATPTAINLDFDISGFTYNPHFTWDASTNTYKRFQANEAHTDERTKIQLAPSVVVAIVLPSSIVNTIDGSRYEYTTSGDGIAYVFQDGGVTQGRWSKAGLMGNIMFKDSAGAEIKLNPGQTWISAVSGSNKVTFTP